MKTRIGLLKHITSQPFIVATGIAALVHSTWSIATYFSGTEPALRFSPEWLAWVSVAFLIAFSMDIGQIVTSAEIRAGQRTWPKYLTFAIFAVATYYAQFLYISSHMPVVPLAAGMRRDWADLAQWLRDASVFILPALLPASTLLYTFSQADDKPIGDLLQSGEGGEQTSKALIVPDEEDTTLVVEMPDRPLVAPNGNHHGAAHTVKS
jgi:hypothetical protein